MPESLKIGVFVFGAILMLIALVGGNFEIFGTKVTAIVSNKFLRFLAFVLGATFLVIAMYSFYGEMSVVPTPSPAKPTQPVSSSPSPSIVNSPIPPQPPVTLSPTPLQPPVTSSLLGQPPPQTWEGTFKQINYGNYPMILYIERVSGTTFSGKLRWTTLRNSITAMNGKTIKDFGDFIERSKWEFVKGFNTDKDGTWLTFTETQLLQGSGIILDTVYYAHLKDDGIMEGVCFVNEQASQPIGSFDIELKR